jgi:hypothetical protein
MRIINNIDDFVVSESTRILSLLNKIELKTMAQVARCIFDLFRSERRGIRASLAINFQSPHLLAPTSSHSRN